MMRTGETVGAAQSRVVTQPIKEYLSSIHELFVRLRWPVLGSALLFLAVATHWPVRKGFFQTDDFIWLRLAHWPSVLDSFIGNQGSNLAYRPIFRLSTYLDALAFGRNASAWHFHNVVLHALNALLLAALLRAWRLPFALAGGTALLFVLAPLSGESVNWISGRGSLLCFTFTLIALWRWTAALRDGRRPWAALAWMVVAGMSYEAAIVVPPLLLCLTPLLCRRFGLSWRAAAQNLLLAFACFAAFWLIRSALLGSLTGVVDAANGDYAVNFLHHVQALGEFTRLLGGPQCFALLGVATAITLLSRRIAAAGLVMLLAAIILMLPYSSIIGIGGRYFYMLQAPLCVLALLPILLVERQMQAPLVALVLLLVGPKFANSDWHEAFSFTRAGVSTEALVEAVVRDIPIGDGEPNVIDGVPDLDHGQMMMGDFFELCIGDFYPGPAPWIARSEAIFRNAAVQRDILSRPSHFWRYDPANRRVLPIDQQDWLAAHPEAR